MKKALIIIAVTATLLLGVAFFLAFNAEKVFKYFGPFETTLFSVKTDIEKEYIDFEFQLSFLSKIPFRFFVDSMEYNISFDSTRFSEGSKVFQKYFSRGDRDTLTLPLRVKMDSIKKKIKMWDAGDSTTLYINLIVFADVPLAGTTDIHINIDKRIPAPQPPKIKITNVAIDRFAFKDMQLSLSMKLINRNPISLAIKDAELQIDFPELFKGKILFQDNITIEANDSSNVEARIITEDLELVRDGLNILFNKEKRDYMLTGNMKLIPPKTPQNEIKLIIQSEGETHLMKRRREKEQENQ